MAEYYIDFFDGDDAFDGLSPKTAKKDHSLINLIAGDSVLFKRGSIIKGMLNIVSGAEDAPIRYGAYGVGDKPVFYNSEALDSFEDWTLTEIPNVWKCTKNINGDVGNFVLDGKCVATLRWTRDELCSQGDFFDSRFADGEQRGRNYSEQELLFYSCENPARVYDSIECVSYANRVLGVIKSNIIIEDICFMNSGVHALAGNGKNVVIRRCDFKNIGGCAWNRDLRIRFGNAVEFWNYAENVLIEDCCFNNVYDSCVTHQGEPPLLLSAKNFVCRNNVFDTYGMAALELRDIVAKGLYFMNNSCDNAGCGFAMLGEELPRRSEIWPEPMGHHIFLWRMKKAVEDGYVEITHNSFKGAPVGAAIYSIISQEAEKQFFIDNNEYFKGQMLVARYAGIDFCDFDSFVKETKNDKNGKLVLI